MFGWYWLADACQAAGLHLRPGPRALPQGHSRRQEQERPHRLRKDRPPAALQSDPARPTSIPPHKRPLRALLRQRLYFVWRRAELLARIQSHQLAHNRPTLTDKPARNRDPWEQQLLAAEDRSPPPARPAKRPGHDPPLRHADRRRSKTQLQRQAKTSRRPRLRPAPNRARHRRAPRA